jgi:glycosyltransferase involved in cell wall biosynthesis
MASGVMTLSIFDYTNTNTSHREALLNAMNRVNSLGSNNKNVVIVVSTRNMIKVLPAVLFRRIRTIINIVGFGRLYSDYGCLGRAIFNSIVWAHDRTTALAFIVEHDEDRLLLEKFVRKPVFTTHGSGLNTKGMTSRRTQSGKILRIGYLSRFGKSKGSHEVLKAAMNLTEDKSLFIAGWDIRGSHYSKLFAEISKKKENITFLGAIKSREEISSFFNNIDLFLSPSVREGGNIALQEAIWHGVPFFTTIAPGCSVLAQTFGCPAVEMENFGALIAKTTAKELGYDTSSWPRLIEPFLVNSVKEEYYEVLLTALNLRGKQ